MRYGDYVREACARKNMKITHVEAACGFPKGTTHRWNSVIPQIDKFEKVADVLGCSIDELCGRKIVENPAFVENAARQLVAEYNDDDMMMLQAFHTLPDADRLQVMNLLMRLKFKKE